MNLLDQLFGDNAQPIRRDATFLHKSDGLGNSKIEAVEGSSVTLSGEAIDSAKLVGFFHCGHVTTDGIGGKCGEPGCANICCKQCFATSRCAQCLKPLCLEHVNELTTETLTVRLCLSCHATVSRRLRWRRLFRALLSPFVTFEDQSIR